MRPPTLLHSGDGLQVLHRPGPPGLTLVIFNIFGERLTGDYFWGDGFARSAGLNAIGIMGDSNWFPEAALHAALPALRPAITGEITTYGSSMGGYGALRYARLLGATTALAFAPQISIDPADVPWDRRWPRHFNPALHAGMRIRAEHLPPQAAAVFDPHEHLDARHAALLPPACTRLALPFSGHGPATTVAQAHALPELLAALRAGQPARARQTLRTARRLAPHHALEMAMTRLARRRYTWLARIANHLARLDTTPATALLLHACIAAGQANHPAATTLATQSATHGPAHPRVQAAFNSLMASLETGTASSS